MPAAVGSPKLLIMANSAARRSRLRELLAEYRAGSDVLEADNCVAAMHLAHQYGSTLSETVLELADSQDQHRLSRLVSSLDLRLELNNDSSLIPPVVCHLLQQITTLRLVEEIQLVPLSIALSESLSNAIHHGNLELSSELRQVDESVYYDLAAARRVMWPYCDRKVQVLASYSKERLKFVIRDDGPGFDVAGVDDPTEMKNLTRIGGRGLLLIRTFMDEVSHNACGNEVTLVKYTSAGSALLAQLNVPESWIASSETPLLSRV